MALHIAKEPVARPEHDGDYRHDDNKFLPVHPLVSPFPAAQCRPPHHNTSMNHADHVRLIAGGIPVQGGVWADMGSGNGAFTLALRDIAGPDVRIYAIDSNQGVLRGLIDQIGRIFPDTNLIVQVADMTGPVDLPPLDGIIAANALHFVEQRKQTAVLREWRSLLKPEGCLIIVEYDAEEGNRWVPHPISFRALQRMAANAGYQPPKQIGSRESQFLDSIYAARLLPVQRSLDSLVR